jgi:hypothetical protein
MLSGIIDRASPTALSIDPRNAAFTAIAPMLFVAIWRTTFEADEKLLDAQLFVDQHIESFVRAFARGRDAGGTIIDRRSSFRMRGINADGKRMQASISCCSRRVDHGTGGAARGERGRRSIHA